MADERGGAPELSRIVGLIMEKPELIEEISKLASKSDDSVRTESKETKTEAETKTASATVSTPRGRRSALLYALKPFLSESRASAIDSMVTFGEVLEVMRSGGK